MKKIIILLLSLLLVSCSTISTVVESAYTGVPTWAIKTPEKKGYIYFVTKRKKYKVWVEEKLC